MSTTPNYERLRGLHNEGDRLSVRAWDAYQRKTKVAVAVFVLQEGGTLEGKGRTIEEACAHVVAQLPAERPPRPRKEEEG